MNIYTEYLPDEIQRNVDWVNKWIDRLRKHHGPGYKYKDDDGKWLDYGQYATFIARGKHWNKSLDNRPDPEDSDIAILRQFEEDGYKWLKVEDIP